MDYPRVINDGEITNLKKKCRICGKTKKLTKEHIPPQCLRKDDYINAFIPTKNVLKNEMKLYRIPKGYYIYSLCEECNARLGNKYVADFKQFINQFNNKRYFDVNENYIFKIVDFYPLRVIKQIYSMFLSLQSFNNPMFIKLQKYVINYKQRMNVLPNVFIYFNKSLNYRLWPCVGRTNFSNHTMNNFAEIAFPPVSFVITDHKCNCFDNLTSISYFNKYTYYEKVDLTISLPHFFVETPYALGLGFGKEVDQNISNNLYGYFLNDNMLSDTSELIKLGAVESPLF